MRWIDVIRISVTMLRTNGLRSVLTILGIGVAISLIVLLIGLGVGLQNITIGSIVQSKTLLSIDVSSLDRDAKPLTMDDVAAIKSIAGVGDVTPVIVTDGQITIDKKLAAISLEAANPSYFDMQGIKVKEGGAAFTEGATEIVVSPKVLDLLDLSETGIVGGNAELAYTDPNNQNETKKIGNVVIVGIADQVDTATIYTPYSLLAQDSSVKLTEIKAVATNRDTLVAARDAILAKKYVADTLVDTLDQARTVFRWVTLGLGGFGTIALIVAAIGMFNTLTISLLERTREIGIMKAIGVTDKAVKRLFLAEAVMIGFMGGLSGIGLGLLGDQILSFIINQFALKYGGFKLDLFQYPTAFLPTMVLYPSVLAFITGFYPALRASRLNPLKALRYE